MNDERAGERTDRGRDETVSRVGIRLATLDDVAAILAISNHAAEHTPVNFAIEPESLESWETSFRDTHASYPWFVAIGDDGAVVGFAKASPWEGRCAYSHSVEVTAYVNADHHGRGIGTALYEWLFATLKEQGYRSVVCGITIPNEASVRLHESFGLEQVALFKQIGWKFDAWHDVGYWQGLLEPDAPPSPIRLVREVMEEMEE